MSTEVVPLKQRLTKTAYVAVLVALILAVVHVSARLLWSLDHVKARSVGEYLPSGTYSRKKILFLTDVDGNTTGPVQTANDWVRYQADGPFDFVWDHVVAAAMLAILVALLLALVMLLAMVIMTIVDVLMMFVVWLVRGESIHPVLRTPWKDATHNNHDENGDQGGSEPPTAPIFMFVVAAIGASGYIWVADIVMSDIYYYLS